MKIPLAWLQLSREKIRLLIALAGITFADILIFMQLGFKSALLNSSIRFHEQLNGEVFLISPQSDALIAMKSFSSRRLYEALGIEGVKSVNPIYIGFSIWKNPDLGFIPGFAVSSFLYLQAASATGLPILMTKNLMISVFILTVIMCFLSGTIAVNKLKSADPADIF